MHNLLARDFISCTAATVKIVVDAVASIMVNVLVSGSRSSGSSPGRGHCVVFLGKTRFLTVPLSTQVYKWDPANQMLGEGGNPAME